MDEEIEAIFLDTNVFERAKFEYENNNFAKLLNLCQEHDIPIYIDYIVEQEVLHRIRENVSNSTEGLKKDKLFYLSKVYNIATNIQDIQKTLSAKLISDFTNLKSAHLSTLDNNTSALEVASMYFETEAPFAEGMKKHEFPDAIIGVNIKKYIEEESINVLTITHDNGLISFFDNNNLPVVNIVSAAVSMINKQFQTDTYFSDIKDNVKENIRDYIREKNIEFNIFAYDYQDSVYVTSYTITTIDIQDILLIDRDNAQGLLTLTCPCNLTIEATTDYYPDYENGMLDKEDHNWYCFSSKSTTHIIKEDIEPTFEISEIEENGKSIYIDYIGSDIDIEFDLYGHNIIKEEYSNSTDREYIFQ